MPTDISALQQIPPRITDAEAPFNIEGDIFIRSGDGVDFRVFRSLLSFASPIFKNMFTLPQNQVNQELKDGLYIIPVTEDEHTLDLLLRYCYPVWQGEIGKPSLEMLISVLEASRKYVMDGVEKYVRRDLIASQFAIEEPLRFYALAVSHGLEAETRAAAKETLRLPVLGRKYVEELEHITAGALHRLQEYQVKCAEVAVAVANNLEWIATDSSVWFECLECRAHNYNNGPSVTISNNRRKWIMSRWWAEYLTKATAALADRPSGASVTDAALVDEAIGKACICTCCRGRVFREMRLFSETFAAEVDRATAKILLEIKLK